MPAYSLKSWLTWAVLGFFIFLSGGVFRLNWVLWVGVAFLGIAILIFVGTIIVGVRLDRREGRDGIQTWAHRPDEKRSMKTSERIKLTSNRTAITDRGFTGGGRGWVQVAVTPWAMTAFASFS